MDGRAGKLTLEEVDRRALAPWAADCAERVLRLFEAKAPLDTRPREAIAGLRAFGRGEMRVGELRTLSARAHAAAREVADPAATSAARAAGHAAGTAHMAAHARGASAYAAQAIALDAGAAGPGRSEIGRQLGRADQSVLAALRRLPAPPRSASQLGVLLAELHAGVRNGRRAAVR